MDNENTDCCEKSQFLILLRDHNNDCVIITVIKFFKKIKIYGKSSEKVTSHRLFFYFYIYYNE